MGVATTYVHIDGLHVSRPSGTADSWRKERGGTLITVILGKEEMEGLWWEEVCQGQALTDCANNFEILRRIKALSAKHSTKNCHQLNAVNKQVPYH